MENYLKWIKENIVDSYGTCAESTILMNKQFPELKRIGGFYHCAFWGKREHWWLVDENNNIIDPTASQFPSKGNGEYEPLPENYKNPTGMCLNCGEYVFDYESFCTKTCERIVMADYQ